MAVNGSWTKSLFVGLWTVLNFCRKLFFNLIFIFLVVVIIIAVSGGEEPHSVNPDSALYLNLKGNLVIEKESVDPFEQFMQEALGEEPDNPEVLVRDVVKALENAKQDKRIKALVLDLQGLTGGGLDKLREIARAIDDFKTSEKPVYALGDFYSQNQYYLAAHADHLYLNPMGALLLEGYGRYGLYFKNLLEKLKISTHIFRVGTYKSAVEPFMRNDMSDAAREANREWLDTYWSQYKADVASARNLDPTNFDEKLDVLVEKFGAVGGDFAQYALKNNWVDALKTREEVRTELVALVGTDEKGTGINYTTLDTYLKVINPPLPHIETNADKVAIVVAKGTILNGEQKAGAIGGDSTARLLRKARLDDKVKAVVLQVDSPGGSAFASEVIRQEILELKAVGKPVVVSMSTYAASGGYWISASADRIYASPSTITGSIGVFGLFMTYEKSLDYIGVNTDGVGSTELAGLSPLRPLDPRVGQILQTSVEHSYQQFLDLVSSNRGLSVEDVDKIAQGRVWIGETAKQLGLVDELGELDDAIASAAEFAGLEHYETFYVERTLSPQELFWKEFFGQAFVQAAKMQFSDSNSALMDMVKQVISKFDWYQQLNDPRGVYVLCLQCQAG
ncbi:signal peptide peptidase SppA [Alteromonas aestuariivivens]|uniref:Signal peptide peptidase SppA n=1 Tax=Alteromonas aestuariivivens TaxID=1938339 RepID=A0A3D8M8E5_9ALTE|nr:signal peptide peptidase SppA [Alteromonas aestuariivivens]RDV26161.1 signal peptide peptidase SppA [Alteromonas aestuariivivens]